MVSGSPPQSLWLQWDVPVRSIALSLALSLLQRWDGIQGRGAAPFLFIELQCPSGCAKVAAPASRLTEA